MSLSLGTTGAISNSQIASTLQNFQPVLRDNVSDATPLLSFLMGSMGESLRGRRGIDGNLPTVVVGGRDIEVSVSLLANTTVGSYSGRDTLDVSDQDTDRVAQYPIRQSAGTVSVSGRERRANKGGPAIYDLLRGKTMRMQNDLRMNISEQAVSDGTGNNGKDMDGLASIISTGTLANLAPATYPRWQPGGFASGNSRHGLITSLGSFASNGLVNMRLLYRRLMNGDDKPDMIAMAKDVEGYFETSLTATGNGTIQYTTFEFGETGFEGLKFKGAMVFSDFDIADGTIYFLNSSHIQLVRDSEADFAWLDPEDALVRPPDQDAFIKVMIVEGNVVTDERRKLGSITGATA